MGPKRADLSPDRWMDRWTSGNSPLCPLGPLPKKEGRRREWKEGKLQGKKEGRKEGRKKERRDGRKGRNGEMGGRKQGR